MSDETQPKEDMEKALKAMEARLAYALAQLAGFKEVVSKDLN